MFFNEKRTIFVIFYVDDFLVCYSSQAKEEALSLIEALKRIYELKDQGPVNYYLGVRVVRKREESLLWLSHDAYLEKVAKRFGLTNGKCKDPKESQWHRQV